MAGKLERLYAEWSGLTLAQMRRLQHKQPSPYKVAKFQGILRERAGSLKPRPSWQDIRATLPPLTKLRNHPLDAGPPPSYLLRQLLALSSFEC